MGCYNCKCEFCARSSELCSIYQTPGEIDDIDKVCYTCEDCKYWDGDLNKKSQKRIKCDGYDEPKKNTKAKDLAKKEQLKRAEAKAAERRKHFRLISK